MQKSNRGIWVDDVVQKDFKLPSSTVMREMGLTMQGVNFVNTIDELRNTPPNIIIAEARRDFSFIQNYFKKQSVKKNVKYVMGLGVYQQLAVINGKKLLRPASVKFKNFYRPYIGQDLTDKSILVFRTGGIGDLLFIQPNLIYLKEKYPTCYIKFACGPQYQSMVNTWECVDEVLDLPFAFSALIDSDYHVLFEGVIERCKEAETVNALRLFSKWMGLNIPDEKLVPKQDPDEDLIIKCKEVLSKWNIEDGSFILMQLRASSPIRTPRHEFWEQIINELNRRGYKVILTDNPRQKDKVTEFIKLLEKPEMVYNFCQYSESIAHSIALTKLAKAVIATDSAMNHIAASLDIPCFGIYGPFPGEIRLSTYPKASWVDAKRHCSPCFIHSPKPCQYASFDGYSPCYDELINTKEKLISLVDKFEDLIK
jgi:ADP-heptose:LPS heptosyltransferase